MKRKNNQICVGYGGGCISILIYTSVFVYIYLSMLKLIYTHGDEKTTNAALILPEETLINYNETKMLLFHTIRKQLENGR